MTGYINHKTWAPFLIGDLEDDGSSKNICNSYCSTWCKIPGDLNFSSIAARTQNLTVCKMLNNSLCESYVYWTVHHLDSWIKTDKLDVTCFIISLFNAQHVPDINTSILRSLWLIFWVISWVLLLWFDVCWGYVVVWLWWCGIRMQAEAVLQPEYGYHTTPAKPQRNPNTHRTRAIQPMK